MSRFRGFFYHGSNLRGREGDPPVQWSREPLVRINPLIHQLAWDEYAAQGHGGQSAERIAERGGFGEHEVIVLLADGLLRARGYTSGPHPNFELEPPADVDRRLSRAIKRLADNEGESA